MDPLRRWCQRKYRLPKRLTWCGRGPFHNEQGNLGHAWCMHLQDARKAGEQIVVLPDLPPEAPKRIACMGKEPAKQPQPLQYCHIS